MKTILLLLSIFLFCSCTTAIGQKKYIGTLVSKFGDKTEGTIQVNLDGANEELIEVSNTQENKTKTTRQSSTTTSKINVAIIDYLLINSKKYYFRDIKIGYNEKYLRNICVELIDGTLDCGIFQTGDGEKEHSISVKLPNQEYSKLISVDFDYYSNSSGLAINVMGCAPVKEKLINKDPTVTWEDGATREERIEKFKTIIREYSQCKEN